jgi:hypothetical protein
VFLMMLAMIGRDEFRNGSAAGSVGPVARGKSRYGVELDERMRRSDKMSISASSMGSNKTISPVESGSDTTKRSLVHSSSLSSFFDDVERLMSYDRSSPSDCCPPDFLGAA